MRVFQNKQIFEESLSLDIFLSFYFWEFFAQFLLEFRELFLLGWSYFVVILDLWAFLEDYCSCLR